MRTHTGHINYTATPSGKVAKKRLDLLQKIARTKKKMSPSDGNENIADAMKVTSNVKVMRNRRNCVTKIHTANDEKRKRPHKKLNKLKNAINKTNLIFQCSLCDKMFASKINFK